MWRKIAAIACVMEDHCWKDWRKELKFLMFMWEAHRQAAQIITICIMNRPQSINLFYWLPMLEILFYVSKAEVQILLMHNAGHFIHLTGMQFETFWMETFLAELFCCDEKYPQETVTLKIPSLWNSGKFGVIKCTLIEDFLHLHFGLF